GTHPHAPPVDAGLFERGEVFVELIRAAAAEAVDLVPVEFRGIIWHARVAGASQTRADGEVERAVVELEMTLVACDSDKSVKGLCAFHNGERIGPQIKCCGDLSWNERDFVHGPF